MVNARAGSTADPAASLIDYRNPQTSGLRIFFVPARNGDPFRLFPIRNRDPLWLFLHVVPGCPACSRDLSRPARKFLYFCGAQKFSIQSLKMGISLPRVVIQLLTRKPYGIHSPFLYDFAENCLYADAKLPEFEKLEDIRNIYKRSKEIIQVTDFGTGASRKAGTRNGQPGRYGKRVRVIARRALQKPRHCRLFYRMSRYLKPSSVLELGSSLGISACYLAMGSPQARVITLEGCPQTASLARQTFRRAGLPQIELVTGPFKSTLPGLLETGFSPDLVYIDGDHTYEGLTENFFSLYEHIPAGGVVIIDDIRWSRDMWRAWKEIIRVPEVRLSLDIGTIGILFFDPRLGKENIPMGF